MLKQHNRKRLEILEFWAEHCNRGGISILYKTIIRIITIAWLVLKNILGWIKLVIEIHYIIYHKTSIKIDHIRSYSRCMTDLHIMDMSALLIQLFDLPITIMETGSKAKIR